MAATVSDLQDFIADSRVGFISIRVPASADAMWQANVRKDAGWSVGEPHATMLGAIESAIGKFRVWYDIHYPSPKVAAPVDDDLSDLLG